MKLSAADKKALKELGIDWSSLWTQLKQVGLTVLLRLIQELMAAQPKKGKKAVGHHDHLASCYETLVSALCTASCAADHYETCCKDHHG